MSLADGKALKRFYKEARAVAGPDGHHVELDGRPVRTPGRRLLAVPTPALAQALADEWAAQGEAVDPMSMPMTRLVNSALDGVAGAIPEVAEEIARYAASDLLCYRADGPEPLVALQRSVWDPVLDWVRERFDARFILSEGVVHVRQPAESLDRIAANLPSDPLRLAALSVLTTLSGSALLALAVQHGFLSSENAWRAAHIDEEVQESLWGSDQEALLRRSNRFRDFESAAKLYALIQN